MSLLLSNLTTVAVSQATALEATLASAGLVLATATKDVALYTESQNYAGALASLAIISAQQVLATATEASVQSSAVAVIEEAMAAIHEVKWEQNNYFEWLAKWPNATFTALFALIFCLHILVGARSRYWYYFGALFAGSGLTFAGYLSRTISVGNEGDMDPFLCQIIVLTISPAFIMAGVYYLLGKLLVLHGNHFSFLQPRWFSYIFISCDLIALIVQAIGGAMAATAASDRTDTGPGTNTMVAGIAFQVVSMSAFLVVFLDFLNRIFFKAAAEVKFSISNIFTLLFNTKKGRELRPFLERNYDPKFAPIRAKPLFNYLYIAIFVEVGVIYIRCVYRVVELAEGWTGYVITHEAFLFALDAIQVFICCTVMLAMHPYFVWGPHADIKRLERLANDEEKGPSIELENRDSHHFSAIRSITRSITRSIEGIEDEENEDSGESSDGGESNGASERFKL